MNKFYKFARQTIPPFLFEICKNSNIYKRSKPFLKKIFGIKLVPQWSRVKVGMLKDVWLYFYPEGEWQKKMLAEDYDKELFDSIRNLNLKGKTIFDIGSHIGYHSIFFSRLVGVDGKIYAFEPNPFNVKRIKENIVKNSIRNIEVRNIALSSKNTETDFIFSEDIENGTSSGGFIDESDTFYNKSTYETEIGFKRMKIPTKKIDDLDELRDKNLKVDILKIDVEGAESLVLEGGMETILRDKPIILIEIHTISNMFYFMNYINAIGYTNKLLKREPDGRHLIMAKQNK